MDVLRAGPPRDGRTRVLWRLSAVQALVAQTVLLALIVAAPFVDLIPSHAEREGACIGWPLAGPLPISFVADGLLLIPYLFTSVGVTEWLLNISAGQRGWKRYLAVFGSAVSFATFFAALGWSLLLWFLVTVIYSLGCSGS